LMGTRKIRQFKFDNKLSELIYTIIHKEEKQTNRLASF
jgi:hypothetical protein